MVTKEIRYPAAPTAAPIRVSQDLFESLARAKAEEWPSAIAGTMLRLNEVKGCNLALFRAGQAAAAKFARGKSNPFEAGEAAAEKRRQAALTADEKLAIGRAIVDHHLAIQEKKGLVVYLRKEDNA